MLNKDIRKEIKISRRKYKKELKENKIWNKQWNEIIKLINQWMIPLISRKLIDIKDNGMKLIFLSNEKIINDNHLIFEYSINANSEIQFQIYDLNTLNFNSIKLSKNIYNTKNEIPKQIEEILKELSFKINRII